MTRVATVVVGAVFGFFLTASGLGDYHTIHRGLLLQDPYIYLMLASSVGVAAAGVRILERRGRTLTGEPLVLPRHPVRRSSLAGGAVFGVGLGIGATCPGITVAMLATGGAYGVVVLAGIMLGLWGRGRAEERERAREVSRARTPTRG